MMTPVCPRLLNMITDLILLRFRARASEDLSAIGVILLLLNNYTFSEHYTAWINISYGEHATGTAPHWQSMQ